MTCFINKMRYVEVKLVVTYSRHPAVESGKIIFCIGSVRRSQVLSDRRERRLLKPARVSRSLRRRESYARVTKHYFSLQGGINADAVRRLMSLKGRCHLDELRDRRPRLEPEGWGSSSAGE